MIEWTEEPLVWRKIQISVPWNGHLYLVHSQHSHRVQGLRQVLSLLLFGHQFVSNSVTPWTAAHQASLSFTISWSLFKLLFIESVVPSNHLIFCRPLLLLPSTFPAAGSFPVSQFFASGGQSIRAAASVLPVNIQGWFPLGLTGLISILSHGLSESP